MTAFKDPYPSNNQKRKYKSGTGLEQLRLEASLWCLTSTFYHRLHMCNNYLRISMKKSKIRNIITEQNKEIGEIDIVLSTFN